MAQAEVLAEEEPGPDPEAPDLSRLEGIRRTAARQPIRILHLTADYPDANKAENTLAIRNFVKGNPAGTHFVVSLNRTANPFRQNLIEDDGKGDRNVVSMRYWGLPFGVLLALAMKIASWRIGRLLRGRRLRIDLVHAHRLTFEGLAGYWLARRLDVPLICSIRGEVESKIFTYKPHYNPLLRRVLDRSARIYYVSAWFRPVLEQRFPAFAAKSAFLPNFAPEMPRPEPDDRRRTRFLTIVRLDAYRRKGLARLLHAFANFARQHSEVHLDVMGDGGEMAKRRIRRLIRTLGLDDKVTLLGRVRHEEMVARMPRYAAMCLPSGNDTFGMAYVEAILCAVPILYSRGAGIDGYLGDFGGGIAVDPRSMSEIERALGTLYARQVELRASLVRQNDHLRALFDGTSQIAAYNRDLGLAA